MATMRVHGPAKTSVTAAARTIHWWMTIHMTPPRRESARNYLVSIIGIDWEAGASMIRVET